MIKINNYYVRDDGLVIFVESIICPIFQYKVILPVECYEAGGYEFDYCSNIYDYKKVDYKVGNRFDKLITS